MKTKWNRLDHMNLYIYILTYKIILLVLRKREIEIENRKIEIK